MVESDVCIWDEILSEIEVAVAEVEELREEALANAIFTQDWDKTRRVGIDTEESREWEARLTHLIFIQQAIKLVGVRLQDGAISSDDAVKEIKMLRNLSKKAMDGTLKVRSHNEGLFGGELGGNVKQIHLIKKD